MTPYYQDESVALYLGDCREILPALGATADCIVTDQPYEETGLAWDRWPDGWLDVAAQVSNSMWCFGSLRMFMDRAPEFRAAGWKLSHDTECEWADHLVWEKHNGSGFTRDRFRRVHEIAAHWYRGRWSGIYHEVPRVPAEFSAKGRTSSSSAVKVPHTGEIGPHHYSDDGTRLARSVIRVPEVRRGISRTQKPEGILSPLIEYACPPGGLVLDMHAGSGSTLAAARTIGRRAIGIESREPQAETAANWLSRATSEAS